jgi:hypothetical protein
MRPYIVSALSAFCVLAAMPLAHAGGAAVGFVAGEVAGNQANSTNTTTTMFGQGNATGASASGTNFAIGGAKNSSVKFSTDGTASSAIAITPFGVTSTSSHSAYATGTSHGNAAFSATNETFGQSSGGVSFMNNSITDQTSAQGSSFKVIGAVAGFGDFGVPTSN